MLNNASLQSIAHRLETVGQGHLLRFYDQLDDGMKKALLAQIASIDLESLPKLIHDYVINKPAFVLPPDVQPAPYYPRDPRGAARSWDPEQFRAIGERMLRDGKVGAFVVAGGQGSRLGYDGPKGCYPAGAVTGKPLFQVFAEALLGARDRYGVRVPWYIMTSPLNHSATVEFFRQHRFFGLEAADVMFFPQGVMPSFDIKTGKVLLASKHEIATNPDGHGGSIRALHVSGALPDMRRRGIDTISYFQVDNPIVSVLDPVFLGLHASAPDSSAQMSSKMVAKASPEEKVGVFCMAGAGARKGRVEIVEYSDLPMDYQRQTNPDGSLRFNGGSIAVHVMGVAFVERLATDPSFALPFHRAEKKIPCIDPTSGEPIDPAANNGVKLERFVFDALPLCEKSVVLETERVEEFAPIKNASGADSPESCARIQTMRAARWLEACGVPVPRAGDGSIDAVLEISARTASSARELRGARLPKAIERGQKLAL
ncbi:MAG TPA: UTP--glucose-1-phosphate uridylyltransferase [Phycisphaerales bacterium]|nr:UTP--glucose-1-phosphate uridylyltransferase [Phycisphaerales bacterium]